VDECKPLAMGTPPPVVLSEDLQRDPEVGWCSLTLSKPKLKPPGTKRVETKIWMNRFQILFSNSTRAATRRVRCGRCALRSRCPAW